MTTWSNFHIKNSSNNYGRFNATVVALRNVQWQWKIEPNRHWEPMKSLHQYDFTELYSIQGQNWFRLIFSCVSTFKSPNTWRTGKWLFVLQVSTQHSLYCLLAHWSSLVLTWVPSPSNTACICARPVEWLFGCPAIYPKLTQFQASLDRTYLLKSRVRSPMWMVLNVSSVVFFLFWKSIEHLVWSVCMCVCVVVLHHVYGVFDRCDRRRQSLKMLFKRSWRWIAIH